MNLVELERTYLQRVARAWAAVDGVPLEQVYVMLEAVRRERCGPLHSPGDLPEEERERLERAGLSPEEMKALLQEAGEGSQEPPSRPVPVGQALQEAPFLVILGEPGAGKTTTLQFIGLCFARRDEGWPQERLGFDEDRIPVRLDLRVLADGPGKEKWPIPWLEHALAEEVGRHLRKPEEVAYTMVETWREAGRLLVLLDGLDEVTAHRDVTVEEIRRFARAAQDRGNQVVVTSRPAGYTALGEPFREYTLKPFRDVGEARPFLEHWLRVLDPDHVKEAPARAEALLAALQERPALRNLVTNPLILRLAAVAYVKEGEVARSRAGLYEAYLKDLWARAVRYRGAPAGWKDAVFAALEELAWRMHTETARDEASVVEVLAAAQDTARGEEMLHVVREQMGLVVRVGDLYAFSHTTFQEYFVAQRLRRAWVANREGCWRFLRPRLHLSAWREPLLLLAGSLELTEVGDLVRRVLKAGSPHERILLRDLNLAAHMVRDGGNLPEGPIDIVLRHTTTIALPPILRRLRTWRLCPRRWQLRPQIRVRAVRILSLLGSMAVPALIRTLREEEWQVRLAGAEALGNVGDKRAVPALLRSLENEDIIVSSRIRTSWYSLEVINVGEKVIQALGRIGDARAIPVLRHVFDTQIQRIEESETRGYFLAGHIRFEGGYVYKFQGLCARIASAAARSLGLLGDTRAMPRLVEALEQWGGRWSWDLGPAIAEALGAIGDAYAVPALLKALRSPHSELSAAAAESLGKIGQPAIPGLVETLGEPGPWVRKNAAKTLKDIGEPVLPGLLQALEDRDWRLRGYYYAIEIFVHLGKAAVPGLLEVLENGGEGARWAAKEALTRIGGPAVSGLLRALRSKDADARVLAAWALGDIGDARAESALWQALRDKDAGVIWAAIDALAEMGDSRVIQALVQGLESEDADVRGHAALILGSIGDKRAIHVLTQILQRGDKQSRLVAVLHLGRIGKPAVPVLLQVLSDEEDNWIRAEAVQMLGNIGDIRAIPELVHLLEDEDVWVRQSAVWALGRFGKSAVSPLLSALEDEDESVRQTAALVLGEIGAPRAVPGLLQIIEEEIPPQNIIPQDIITCTKAMEALGKIGDTRAVPQLVQLLRFGGLEEAAATALGSIGDIRAVPPLIETLGGSGWGRRAVIEALEKIGLPALPFLIEALKTKDIEVRRPIAEVLRNLLPDVTSLMMEQPEEKAIWKNRLHTIVTQAQRWAAEENEMASLLAAAQVRLEALQASTVDDPFAPPPPTWQEQARDYAGQGLRVVTYALLAAMLALILFISGVLQRVMGEQWKPALQAWASQHPYAALAAIAGLAVAVALVETLHRRLARK